MFLADSLLAASILFLSTGAGTAPLSDSSSPGFSRTTDDQETIYTVQRKAFLVKHKFELSPMFAVSFTDSFVTTFGPSASLSYHLAESLAIEASGMLLFPDESDLTDEIYALNLTTEKAKLTQLQWNAGLGLQWSPVYGKLQVFGRSLGNFSFYIGAGAAFGQTRVECVPKSKLDPAVSDSLCPDTEADPSLTQEQRLLQKSYEPSTLRAMGTLTGGVRFYFSDALGLKLEVKDVIFPARVYRPDDEPQKLTDVIRNNIFIQLGVSFLFGGPKN